VRYGLTMTGHPLFVNIAVGELLKANGGRLFDRNGRPTLTERPVVELLDFYKKLHTVLPPGWMSQGYTETFEQLASGKTAMLYQAYGGTGSVSCNSAFVLHLCRFLNHKDLMEREAMVQNPSSHCRDLTGRKVHADEIMDHPVHI